MSGADTSYVKGGGAVSAADITDATAVGEALLTAANAAAQRTALGFGQPTTLRGQAALQALLRTGPLVMTAWSDSDYVGALTAPAGAAQPSIVRGSSGVVVVYSPAAGGYTSTHLAASHNVSPDTRGWIVTALGGDLGLYSISDVAAVAMVGAVATVGWHAAAWSISAGGAVRVSVDGSGAIQTPAGTPAFTPRSGDAVRIGRGVFGACASPVWISDLALFGEVLPDADLQTLSGSASTGLPGTIATASAWEWAAGAHAGQQRVTIDGVTYAVVGVPQLWVP